MIAIGEIANDYLTKTFFFPEHCEHSLKYSTRLMMPAEVAQLPCLF